VLIKMHWYRPDAGAADGSCGYTGCGFPLEDHVSAVGDGALPSHRFRPALRHPLWCTRCGKNWRHFRHWRA